MADEEAGNPGSNVYHIDQSLHFHTGDVHHHHHHHENSANTRADEVSALTLPDISDSKLSEAADEVQKHLWEKLEPDVVFSGLKVDHSSVPVHHPTLTETEVFAEEEDEMDKFFHVTEDNNPYTYKNPKPIRFNDLLATMMGVSFLAVIGPPGSGKTTLSKRLARSGKFFTILIRFMDLGYNFALTLKQLLIDFPFKDLDSTIRNNAFKWMLKNQHKCVIVMDGYDQSVWSLNNQKPPDVSYDTPLSVQQLVANLCCKNFFRKSLLIFTSRPHSILSIPVYFRPKSTVVVGDLPTNAVKEIFFAFAGVNAENLWNVIGTNAPQLLELCHNPLLLQLIVFAGLHGNGGNHSQTITKVFEIILRKLKKSGHGQGMELNKLVKPLGSMAYDGMLRLTVVFTDDDLAREGLTDVNVQDYVINIARCPRLFEGDKATFYFIHQLLQEIFAAYYICLFMPIENFNQTIHQLVNDRHWYMVRRFICGLLLRDGQKKDILIDLQECSSDIQNSFAKFLPSEFDLKYIPISSSAAHGLAQMLPKLDKPVIKLSLWSCNLNTNSLELICNAISKMKYKIEFLNLSGNKFEDEKITSLSRCFTKLRKLRMWGCGISKNELEVFCRQLEKTNTSLEFLDLSGNDVGDDSVTVLTRCLKKVNTIGLWRCQVSENGKKSLQEELKKNEYLPSTIRGLWRTSVNQNRLSIR